MARPSIHEWRVAARLVGLAVAALAACGEVSVDPPGTDSGTGSQPDGSPDPQADAMPIEVVDARPPGDCEGGTVQLLTNPSFEDAMLPDGAIGWTEIPPPVTYPSAQIPVPPDDGNRAVWIGDITRPEQRLIQAVIVPDEATSLALSVATCFATLEAPDEEFDEVRISLRQGGNVLEELARFTNLDASSGCDWDNQVLIAESAYAGEEIQLEFAGLSDGETLTSFYFDTLSLNATCP